MGMICIFLGCIIFLGSILLGVQGSIAVGGIFNTMVAYQAYLPMVRLVIIGASVLFGLLICLNLVMHGLTYNKVCKIEKKLKNK